MNTATHPGADPDVKTDEVSVNSGMSPRNIALEDLQDRADAARIAKIAEDIKGDPGAEAIAARMQEAQDASRAAAVAEGKLPALDDGAASREPMHPEQAVLPAALPEAADTEVLPAELQNDPLADYIVMDGDAPMFALKVNGEDKLINLSDARRRLQIGTAAEIRMQTAALREKDLDVRENQLSVSERALAARTQNIQPELQPQPTLLPAGLDEAEIRTRARDVMTTANFGTEEEAGDKLTKLLMDVRTPQVLPATPIDRSEIAQEAAQMAVSAVTVLHDRKDLADGLTQFKTEYPDVMSDINLYNMADSMTDGIEKENPTWSKSQVMFEAGKRTREWVEDLKGGPVTEVKIETAPAANIETISEHTQPPTAQIRQERKRTLVPIPQAAAAAQPSPEPVEEVQTPRQALDELRKSRGQATST